MRQSSRSDRAVMGVVVNPTPLPGVEAFSASGTDHGVMTNIVFATEEVAR